MYTRRSIDTKRVETFDSFDNYTFLSIESIESIKTQSNVSFPGEINGY